MTDLMSERYDYHLDKNKWYAIQPTNVGHFVKADNVFTLRIEERLYVFNNTFLALAKSIADVFNHAFEPDVEKQLPPEMLKRPLGHDFGMTDYIN